jgi:glucokinase
MTAILADIGGTNTRVALADGKVVRPSSIAKFSNAEFDSLEPILKRIWPKQGLPALKAHVSPLLAPCATAWPR